MLRWSLTSPYTMPYLRMKLDELLGEGTWSYILDYNAYSLTIEAPAIDPAWAHEISVMITQIKPANIIFVSSPVVDQSVLVSEQISMRENLFTWNYVLNSTWKLGEKQFASGDAYQILRAYLDGSYHLDGTPLIEADDGIEWNYVLDTRWVLGRHPFANYITATVIKDWSESSIMAELLVTLAKKTSDVIAKVRINGSFIVSNFSTHQASGNVAYLEYFVPAVAISDPITLIELLNAEDQVLTSANVFVDTTFDILFKHKIQHKEGV